MVKKKKNSRGTYLDIPTHEKATLVARWLSDKKAADVTVLDVAGVCPIAEMLVLATATSPRHAKGLAAHVLDQTAEANIEYLGMEGQKEGAWILVDLNDVLVHLFTGEKRDLYDLEGLWAEGQRVELPEGLCGERDA
ncbi:iojap-like protein [Alkalidesulfovibrio alkalitolerans DSM 16529]|jgi:ribosome-associated protein|uniref:Ribosomal silencing factor RsfS n=1 Tax=Alkalidesulfovibrio alkalitolerans DSM 16529 TaxID=1121439 RepID=S7UCH5_9BACT|nr:ribosome silencing factor [Alkalidesulfovibrio alkalitolerans]EPR31574.1 iojap-like protein [Alkalidesulfovibrio alkalitolerans DSM 16529]